MKVFQSLALAFGFAGLAQAHMEMTYPAPFNSKYNPFAASGSIDYSMTAPLDASGSNFPCKGYHSLFGTAEGAATATFAAGGTFNMTIAGGAFHNGGSCQASLSFDKGKTWKVIHSYIGNCPLQSGGSFDFKIPSDTPAGEAIFAWTWFNKTGNREMYMNCAAVNITGSSAKRASALSSLPDMFVANVGSAGNGCAVTQEADVMFPDPGTEVSMADSNAVAPDGDCGSSGSGSGSGSGDSNTSAAAGTTAVATYTAPAATTAAPADDTTVYVSPSAPASSAITNSPDCSPGGVFITVSQPADSAPTTVANSAPTSVADSAPTTVVDSAPTTTLVTLTKSAGGSVSSASAPAASATSGSGDGSSGSSHTAGTACSNEGEWNCVGGTKFQRCASGTWSVLMAVADGTTCGSSTAEAFAITSARRRRTFRSFRARV
ncbi:hypothetical protein EDB80DRAFT_132231 [Ilyonectria destructans]|nr:hypothetical protein EDB80DRAFT_132231 [Ilyonectria destructans]